MKGYDIAKLSKLSDDELLGLGADFMERALKESRDGLDQKNVPFYIRVFELFDGESGRGDLRVYAMVAMGLAGGSVAIGFLKEVAIEHKADHLGDFALDNMPSDEAQLEQIPFMLTMLEDEGTCDEAKVSAVLTLAKMVGTYRCGENNEHGASPLTLPPDLRQRIDTATSIALSHPIPTMRAFGCRLAAASGSNKESVRNLLGDGTVYYADSTIANEAQQAIESWE